MARVAETIPELWLNRQGFFTMRGLKPHTGHGEIDLVAYHPHDKEAIHVEVSASPNPRGILGNLTASMIPQSVAGYVEDKYLRENVKRAREATAPPSRRTGL